MASQSKQLYFQSTQEYPFNSCSAGGSLTTIWFDDSIVGSTPTLLELVQSSVQIFSNDQFTIPAQVGRYSETNWQTFEPVVYYIWLGSGWQTSPLGDIVNGSCDPVYSNPNLRNIIVNAIEGQFSEDDLSQFLNSGPITLWYENTTDLTFDQIINQSIGLSTLNSQELDPSVSSNRTPIQAGFYGPNSFEFVAYQLSGDTVPVLSWLEKNPNLSEPVFQDVSFPVNYFNVTSDGILQTYSIDLYVYDSGDPISFCELSDTDLPNATVWYSSESGELSLYQIVSNQVPIFQTQSSAIYYSDTGIVIPPNGISGTDPNTGAVWNAWVSDQLGTKYLILTSWFSKSSDGLVLSSSENMVPFPCTAGGGGLETVHSINILARNEDASSISDYCFTQKEETVAYYKSQNELTLSQIATLGINIYKNESGAQNSAASQMFDTNSFGSVTDSYWVFINNDNDGTWQGANGLTSSDIEWPDLLQPIECAEIVTPEPEDQDLYTQVPSNAEDRTVYYAFQSCIPNQDENYLIYIVDALHLETGDPSYVTDFVNFLSDNRVISFSGGGNSQEQIGCKTFIHRVFAISPEDAVDVLNTIYPLSLLQLVDAPVLGILSEAQIEVYSECETCINPIEDPLVYTFPFIEESDDIFKVGPRTDLESNYKLDDRSKPLLRTNPRVSTNIKIVANPDDEIYLESINANKELSDSKYKRYRVSSKGQYAYDISRFYNDNSTPYDIAYSVKREWSDLSVHDLYDKQFEEEYHFGTRLNYSKMHSEKFRMFAPIWLDLNVPRHFVIYRVLEPLPAQSFSDDHIGKFNRIKSMLSNSTLIASFDLTKSSELGKYLRNHVQDQFFPESPLSVTFEKNEETLWRGIDLIKGGFTKKGEYIYKDFVETDKPLIESNDFITGGWQRNKMTCANLINLEFLFDDTESQDYSVNRYFGLYVDEIPSAYGNVANLRDDILRFNNVEGMLDVDNQFDSIPSSKMMNSMPILGYVKSSSGFHNIDNGRYYDHLKGNLAIHSNRTQLTDFLGIKPLNQSAEMERKVTAGFDFVKIDVMSMPGDGDKIATLPVKKQSFRFKLIEHQTGSTLKMESQQQDDAVLWSSGSSAIETFDNLVSAVEGTLFSEMFNVEIKEGSIYVTEKYSLFNNNDVKIETVSGSTVIFQRKEIYSSSILSQNIFTASSSVPKSRFSGQYFSSLGTTKEIASALAGVINSGSELNAFSHGNSVYIKHYAPGFETLASTVMIGVNNHPGSIISDALDQSNRLRISEHILQNWSALVLSGGHSANRACYISADSFEIINVGDRINTQRRGQFNQILAITADIDSLKTGRKIAVLKTQFDLKNGEVELLSDFRCEIGLFSAYDIYDMNFDTYDQSNSDLKELNYEVIKAPDCGVDGYFEYGPGRLLCEAECTDLPDASLGDIDPSLYANPRICQAPDQQFSSLLSVLDPETIEGAGSEKILSEFDRLEENNTTDFAVEGRVVPTINKWSLKDSVTVREEPYFLNVNEAFGRTNFSADITRQGRDPLSFSHEWFYMEQLPAYFDYLMTNNSFSYINFVKGFDLSRAQFKDVEVDYFNIWCWNDGFEVEHQIDQVNFNVFSRKQASKKYSRISGGNENRHASTVFRGLKFIPKKRKEFVNDKAYGFIKDSEFNGYKFTAIVKVNANSDTNLIDYEVIQNKKFKTLSLIIELDLNETNTESWLNRSLLYNLNSRMELSGESYIFSDMPISGAIMLSGIDQNIDGPYVVKGFQHTNDSNPSFTTQIVPNAEGTLGKIQIEYLGIGTYFLEISSVIDDSTLEVTGLPVDIDGNPISAVYLSIGAQASAQYSYIGGGLNGHVAVLEALSANRVSSLFNLNDSSVRYVTVEEDGTLNYNRFVLDIDDGSEVIVRSNLTKEIDQDAPQSYKMFNGNIGYTITERQEYFSFLIRHNGNYTLDLKPVVTFTDVYPHHKIKRNLYSSNPVEYAFKSDLYKINVNQIREIDLSLAWYKRFNRLGVSFNVGFIKDEAMQHDSDWGLIKNHHYHKVNDINSVGVIKLSESGEYLPLYPLIGEVAIDKKDVNVFKSSWEPGYYVRSTSGGESVLVPGTLSTSEEKSYLGSTQIKVLEAYDLHQFTVQQVETEAELDEILRNSNNLSDIVWFENDQQIFADFYMLSVIQSRLSGDGVLETISKYVEADKSFGDKTTLVDDASDYIYRNLVRLFTIDNIEIYTKRVKGVPSQFESPVSIDLADNGGYSLDRDFTYQIHGNLPINFRLIYNKTVGYSHLIRPVVKIQS